MCFGIYEYDKYQMMHPGHSASEQCSQGTELFIGKIKRHGRKKGTGKHNMIDLAAEHIDMTGTCAVYNGQVNFATIIREILGKQMDICPEPLTSYIEKKLESGKMPPAMKLLVSLLNKYLIGESLPQIIALINARARLEAYKLRHEAILELLKENIAKTVVINKDVNSDEYKQAEKRLNKNSKHNNIV